MFLFVLFAIPFSYGKVWIKSPKSSFLEFNTHILSLEDKGHVSYGVNQLEKIRNATKPFSIKQKIVKAQEHYLAGETSLALKKFQEITGLSHASDWNEEERRGIFYSFLRQAQYEKNKTKKQALLIAANQFILTPVHEKSYKDYNLFPPPLMEKLKKAQNNQVFLSVDWKGVFPHHEIVLVNGKQVFPSAERIKIPTGAHRVTALSSSHTPWTKILPLSQLVTQSVQTTSFTSGRCKNLKIKKEWQGDSIQLFQNAQACPSQNIFHKTAQAKPALKEDTELSKTLAIVKESQTDSSLFNKNVFQSTWFWVGAFTAIAVGVVWYLDSTYKPQGDSRPLNTQPLPPSTPVIQKPEKPLSPPKPKPTPSKPQNSFFF